MIDPDMDRPLPAPVDTRSAEQAPAAFGGLLEAMLHAVWIVDARDLCIVAVNRAAGTLLGCAASGLVGRAVTTLVATPEDLAFWADVALGHAAAIESETFVCRADGSAVPVLRRVSRVDASDGEGLYVVALADRTEQLRAERALESAAADLRATLESSRDGFLVTDLNGRIRNFNRRFAVLWQIPTEPLARRDDDAVLDWMRGSVADPGAYMRRLAAIEAAPAEPSTDTLTLRCGRVLERVAVPQLIDGRPSGRIYSFREVESSDAGDSDRPASRRVRATP
jgi:PAS domain S-box-containing protein